MGALAMAVAASLAVPAWAQSQPSFSTNFLAGSGGMIGGREAGTWILRHVPAGSRLLAIGPSTANVLEYYGHRPVSALSVSTNPRDRNPSYAPVLNPDLDLRDGVFQYVVWDAYTAAHSDFFAAETLRLTAKYHGRVVVHQRQQGQESCPARCPRARRRDLRGVPMMSRFRLPGRLAAVGTAGLLATALAAMPRRRERGRRRRTKRSLRSSTSSSSCRAAGPSTTTSALIRARTDCGQGPASRWRPAIPLGNASSRSCWTTAERAPLGANATVIANQWDGGKMDGFVAAYQQQGRDGALAMGYYNAKRVALLLGSGAELRAVRPLLLLGHSTASGTTAPTGSRPARHPAAPAGYRPAATGTCRRSSTGCRRPA